MSGSTSMLVHKDQPLDNVNKLDMSFDAVAKPNRYPLTTKNTQLNLTIDYNDYYTNEQ